MAFVNTGPEGQGEHECSRDKHSTVDHIHLYLVRPW